MDQEHPLTHHITQLLHKMLSEGHEELAKELERMFPTILQQSNDEDLHSMIEEKEVFSRDEVRKLLAAHRIPVLVRIPPVAGLIRNFLENNELDDCSKCGHTTAHLHRDHLEGELENELLGINCTDDKVSHVIDMCPHVLAAVMQLLLEITHFTVGLMTPMQIRNWQVVLDKYTDGGEVFNVKREDDNTLTIRHRMVNLLDDADVVEALAKLRAIHLAQLGTEEALADYQAAHPGEDMPESVAHEILMRLLNALKWTDRPMEAAQHHFERISKTRQLMNKEQE